MSVSWKHIVGVLLMAMANANAANAGWTGSVRIVSLVSTGNGGFNVQTDPPLSGCVSQSGYGPNWASIYPSHPGLKLLMAQMLTAYSMQKWVRLYFGDTQCTVSEAIVGDSP